MLKILQADKRKWNGFLINNNASFLQSWEWGNFQETLGRKVWRIAVAGANENIWGQMLLIKKPLPLNKNYLYVPFGPCLENSLTARQKNEVLALLLKNIEQISQQEKAVYCYIEPFWGLFSFETFPQVFQEKIKVAKPQKRIQPQKTLVIDLSPSEEQIFKNLKSKTTRYNIRFAQKQGVKFLAPQKIGDKEIQIFYDLAQKSAQRDGFVNYPKEYFVNLFSVSGCSLGPHNSKAQDLFAEYASSEQMQVQLFFSQYEKEIIAANIFIFFGKIAVHLFGGFNYDFRKLMAPYFMHYQQMLFAKNKMGCTIYDFWGIDEKKWPGVTHFKRSFGGKEIEYPTGYDIVIDNFWYGFFKTARKILNKIKK